jgi:nucleotide-binding universal stress UspA family protein
MSRIAHILVGGAATTAAHALPASLLIARRAPAHDRFGEHIMVASDGLERSDDLVDFAAGLAQEHDSSLTLLHVIHGESSHHPTRIAAQVRRVTGALGERARVRIEPGRASGLIVKTAAAERCSLIIVSSRRVGGIRALGSVSERESRRRESHPPALAEPGVNVSAHRAPIVQPSGRKPQRQWANRPGWRRATSAMNLRARP